MTNDLVNAYEQLSPVLLPHLAGHPLTLKRYPDDIHGEAFWEKDAPSFTPKWVKTVAVPRKHEPAVIRYITIPDAKTLGWAASMGCIEIHSFLHKYPYLTCPTAIAFDLDPGEGANILDCCEVALLLKEWLGKRGLESFVKVSGSKGLQVYVPLNTPTSYSLTQPLARRVAEELERQRPKQIISRMARTERNGKVFIDWSQNAEHKTTVSVYSIRAKHDTPYVSMPVSWGEIESALGKSGLHTLTFNPEQAIQRVRHIGDMFAPVLSMTQSIPAGLLAELRLQPASVPPHPVTAPPKDARPYSLPRSSGQGGRKLFVIHRIDRAFDLGLERNGAFQIYRMDEVPTTKTRASGAQQEGTRQLSYLTEESAASGFVWDLGTYEVVEGSFGRGHLDICLNGRKLDGEWVLDRADDRQWQFTNKAGRQKRRIPPGGSALAAIERPGRMRHAG